MAEELKTIHIDEHMKVITLDINDLYVNLPIQGILQTTKFWLSKHNNTDTTIEQTLQLLARMKCIKRRKRINQNDYIQKRKIANGICKKKEGMAT